MPKTDKAKTAGKFVIVMLSLAILFFLLLPFLDNSAPGADAAGKKAVPQIFTSNPLSELVRKVYNLFARSHSRPNIPQVRQYASAQGGPSFDAAETAAQERYAPENGSAEGSSSVGASYGYGNAGIINEDGEWVLVRQTAPEAGQRGMHEVNSSDTAYDKLVRLERAAKYTGGPVKAAPYPDSKWARLWRPIKNFFTGSSDGPSALPQEQAFALASAPAGAQNASGAPGSYKRAQTPSMGGANLPSAGGAAEDSASLFDMLNPERGLNDVVENLKAIAAKELDKDQQKQFEKDIDNRHELVMELAKQKAKEIILQDAQGAEPQDLVPNTHPCSGGASGLYKKSPSCDGLPPEYPTKEQIEQKRNEGDNQAKKDQKNSLQYLSELAGIPLKQEDLKMVVVLGKVTDANPMSNLARNPEPAPQGASEEEKQKIEEENERRKREDETLKKYYDFMIKTQGCDKQNCYWVGGEVQQNPAMRNSIQSSGMEYIGDPLSVDRRLMEQFTQMLGKEKNPELDVSNVQNDLSNYGSYYVPYTQKDMDELNKRNYFDANNPKKPKDGFAVYVPSAANAADMLEVLPNPGVVIYDDNNAEILDQSAELTPAQRGERIRQLVVERAKEGMMVLKEARNDLSQYGLTAIMSGASQKAAKDIRRHGSNTDSVMGLDAPK